METNSTLRCEKIANMLFFVAFFGRFLGIIQVARLEMCNISKFSERFIVFNGANSFPIEQFKLFEILRKRPIFIPGPSVWFLTNNF
jgi:hypothetical protein